MFDWKIVPKTEQGFVKYDVIRSMQVRIMVAKAERVKLLEELKARQQWQETQENLGRLKNIQVHLKYLDSLFA